MASGIGERHSPWEVNAKYLILDRGSTFSAEVRGAIGSMGLKIKRAGRWETPSLA